MKRLGHETVVSTGRRQFLCAASGATLALPLLPSLLSPHEAAAQAATQQKCLAYLLLAHGGCSQVNMFPSDALLTETRSYAGHAIRRGALVSTSVNGEVRLSEVLRASSTLLTPGLLAKMNLLRGVDLPFYVGHGFGPALGNFGDTTIGSGDEFNRRFAAMTIDQILGWSPSFYPNAATIRERVITLGGASWYHSNPATRTGPLQRVADSAPTNVALFDKIFGTTTVAMPGSNAPAPIVDQVLESYRRLRTSGRLSALDAQRLDDHMQRIAELQRKLAQTAPVATVARPTTSTDTVRSASNFPIDPAAHGRCWSLWTDVVAAAFSVGASRVFSAFVNESFSNAPGDWHDIIHATEIGAEFQDGALQKISIANRQFFQGAFLEFARKLDAIAAPAGGTLLDNTLLVWTHESGSPSHYGFGGPIVTMGSAGGFLRTGQYCDYRNLAKVANQIETIPGERGWYGLLIHQWLGTVLQAMGVPASEYAGLAGGAAYPAGRTDDFTGPNTYPASVWSVAGEVMPWLRA
jgi:hypothetical protein